ncbi:MAG: hypothetical protein HPY61_14110 [Methanotrichaceae archaeon]|nr:hypothetical protein [Methanotrichaceae archaeon]
MAEITELNIKFVEISDGKEYIRAGTYNLSITKETLPILIEVAQRVRFNFVYGKGFS